MEIDKRQLESLLSLFSEAEAKVKEAEGIDGAISVPSINELRYVGYHLTRALANEDPREVEQELTKAANHARRAIYYASEAQIIFLLEKVKDFHVRDRQSASVTDVISDYLTLMECAEAAKQQIAATRSKNIPVDRPDYYQLCQPHIDSLKKIVLRLELAEPEIYKKERQSARNFMIAIAALVATLLGVGIAVAQWIQ